MYLAIEFEYGYSWDKFSPEEYMELRVAIPSLPDEKPRYRPDGTHIITSESIPVLAKHKITFTVSTDEKSQAIGSMLVKLQDRIRTLEMRGASESELIAKGAAVQVVIPDFALLHINEVTWLEDACTENLQSHLNEGWRILAVCPPNAQRRPDYILGRRK